MKLKSAQGPEGAALELASPIACMDNAFKSPVIPKHAIEILSEDKIKKMKARQKGRPKGQGKGSKWTPEEVAVLKEKVEIFYEPTKRMPWKKIKDAAGEALQSRTEMDCKDKWRNMQPKKRKRSFVTLNVQSGDDIESDDDE